MEHKDNKGKVEEIKKDKTLAEQLEEADDETKLNFYELLIDSGFFYGTHMQTPMVHICPPPLKKDKP